MNSSGRNVFPAELLVPRLSTRRIAVKTAIENASNDRIREICRYSIPHSEWNGTKRGLMRSLQVCKIVFL